MNKPFFSIVIPCYNSRQMIGDMLQSIVNQGMEKEEIEVILADDCSTEPYDDVVEPYEKRLSIVKTKTDYNYCPANTRQKGAEKASGEWLVFADHDDVFLPAVLPLVKKEIEETNERLYLGTYFYEINPFTRKPKKVMNPQSGWTHGKFYNKENLWDKYNLSYKKNLTSHEDIYLSSLVQCALHSEGVEPRTSNLKTYAWRAWPKSQSKSTYTGEDGRTHDFLQVFFRDYIASTGDVYLAKYKEGVIDVDYAKNVCMEILGYCYFYCQGFIFREPQTHIKKNDWYSKCYFRKIKNTFKVDVIDVVKFFYSGGSCEVWEKLKQLATIATGKMIEPESLIHWLQRIEKVEKPK